MTNNSDGEGRKDTLISGFTDDDDLSNLDHLNLSGSMLIEQTKKADQKL